ncbi:unnamed protein product [Hermetia illucens]|uniref:Uncharacterized protein n=1 Tax=Hermetia illucens TaxID=343691 RepID=A0A7R8UT33_HERIL|nr:uncharacterized protein LOC119651727 [Hermetia illucens]CAD7086023.1 unnamed protein product [Hermetia illucens]
MPGVVFLIVVPTSNFETELAKGQQRQQELGQQWDNNELSPFRQRIGGVNGVHGHGGGGGGGNNLNINLPDNNGVLRLEVELRDKNAGKQKRGAGRGYGRGGVGQAGRGGGRVKATRTPNNEQKSSSADVLIPMEKILEELLSKLEIEHVTWTTDRKGYYHHVIFPIPSGEPCETTLHCLTELGIGIRWNSSVSVLPCSVSYDALTANEMLEDDENDPEVRSKWNQFVESIKSKLTVKQVVDGVRAGGSISFDYILLIVTADSLAALGLIENNAPNIVAAMLVSPLMGPVMSITFGTIISDYKLIKVGFMTLALGMFISLLFGFIFGLIVGTTDMPWGWTDWPTEEMKGRGNVRSLWMGVCWALTSGTGVAVALLLGATGPLIGVAISASLLPPVVNCGLFWGLACIWLIYPGIKMPHLQGEPYTGNSSYKFLYTNYVPTEFFINGIVSGVLTVVNVICIFITAIIVLKIKEVAAPYTSSPDLRRFWETDIRTARETNRSTIRGKRASTLAYSALNEPKTAEMKAALEQAFKEASHDETFRKVKRMSYSSNAVGEITRRLPFSETSADQHTSHSGHATPQTSIYNADPKLLDKLVSTLLLERNNPEKIIRTPSGRLSRRRTLSRSFSNVLGRSSKTLPQNLVTPNDLHNSGIQLTSFMPTIMEQNQPPAKPSRVDRGSRNSSFKSVLNSIGMSAQRLSQNLSSNDEEKANLAENILQ